MHPNNSARRKGRAIPVCRAQIVARNEPATALFSAQVFAIFREEAKGKWRGFSFFGNLAKFTLHFYVLCCLQRTLAKFLWVP
jgi:hypothetical protein